MFVFIAWMCLSVVLNHSRAHKLSPNVWFCSTCVTMFLCFSFPYAFSKKSLIRVFKILAITTVVSVTFLSIIGLLAAFFHTITTLAPGLFSGFGFFNGRLSFDDHPNRSAPFCALAIVLTTILFMQTKKRYSGYCWSFCGIMCFVALALTDSRTGIFSMCVAVDWMYS